MDPLYMQYTIQSDLKNYSEALSIISKGGDKYFTESLAMVKKQRLFKQALSDYEYNPEL